MYCRSLPKTSFKSSSTANSKALGCHRPCINFAQEAWWGVGWILDTQVLPDVDAGKYRTYAFNMHKRANLPAPASSMI